MGSGSKCKENCMIFILQLILNLEFYPIWRNLCFLEIYKIFKNVAFHHFYLFFSATVVAPEGFWDPVVTVKSPEKVPTLPVNKKKKKVAEPVEKDRGKEFDSWCVSALDGLGAQVDIPTFLAFLKDIESPYEVS